MKCMPWKNGQGSTREVAISPREAKLEDLDFDWRLSIATVDADGPFSVFKGFDRWLIVWEGPGLELNETRVGCLEPVAFSGETQTTARLIGAPVKDFGLIYNRDKYHAEMSTGNLTAGTTWARDFLEGEHFLLCASGSFSLGEYVLTPGDVIHVESFQSVEIRADLHSKFVYAIATPIFF
jgi:environmental stress-induced protein Ves